MKARVDAAIAAIDANSASAVIDGQVHVIRSEALRQLVLNMGYMPTYPLDWIAEAIVDLLNGDYEEDVVQMTPADFNSSEFRFVPMTEIGAVIRCLDIQAERPFDIAWGRDIYASMEERSPTAAPAWAILALRCAGFTLQPAYDFHGAFGSPAPDESDPDTPAAPVLLVSSRFDPVTPLAGAWAMSRQHANSSVVIAELPGHDPFWPSSDCMRDILREYWSYGIVPPNGTVCVPDPDSAEEEGDPMAAPNGGMLL